MRGTSSLADFRAHVAVKCSYRRLHRGSTRNAAVPAQDQTLEIPDRHSALSVGLADFAGWADDGK